MTEREALAKGCREWEDRHTEACPATREFVEFLGEWMWTAALAARGDTFTRREVDEIAGLCRHMGYESAEAIVQLREEGRLPFAAREEPQPSDEEAMNAAWLAYYGSHNVPDKHEGKLYAWQNAWHAALKHARAPDPMGEGLPDD